MHIILEENKNKTMLQILNYTIKLQIKEFTMNVHVNFILIQGYDEKNASVHSFQSHKMNLKVKLLVTYIQLLDQYYNYSLIFHIVHFPSKNLACNSSHNVINFKKIYQ